MEYPKDLKPRNLEPHLLAMRTRVLMGPITRELWRVKDYSIQRLYHWNPRTQRYGCLSQQARLVLHDAHESVTGMLMGPNGYWLAQTMSEAIEAAETLGL